MSPCRFADDVDLAGAGASSNLARHLVTCEACAKSVALRSRARLAWADAKAKDDEDEAVLRERRLARRMRVRLPERRPWARAAFAITFAVALSAAGGVTAIGVHRLVAARAELLATATPPPTPPPASAAAPALPPPPAPAPPPEPTPEPTPVPPAPRALAPAPPPDDGESLWESAEGALGRGDRPRAEAALATLLARPRPRALARKATLRLGELLLARGATAEARARLEPLALSGRDASGDDAADDAAWLYARTFPKGLPRAAAWQRYLESRPAEAGPMQDLAQIERANALLDGQDRDAAAVIAASFRGRSLAPVASAALARLHARLEP